MGNEIGRVGADPTPEQIINSKAYTLKHNLKIGDLIKVVVNRDGTRDDPMMYVVDQRLQDGCMVLQRKRFPFLCTSLDQLDDVEIEWSRVSEATCENKSLEDGASI